MYSSLRLVVARHGHQGLPSCSQFSKQLGTHCLSQCQGWPGRCYPLAFQDMLSSAKFKPRVLLSLRPFGELVGLWVGVNRKGCVKDPNGGEWGEQHRVGAWEQAEPSIWGCSHISSSFLLPPPPPHHPASSSPSHPAPLPPLIPSSPSSFSLLPFFLLLCPFSLSSSPSFIFLFTVLLMEARALHVADKHSTTELC